MVAIAARLNLVLALVIVGVSTFAHGHAHGSEMPASADVLAFSVGVGFVIATGIKMAKR
jgi:urease accessory protein